MPVFKTRQIHIGDISMGGNTPIRIQSMTSTNTMDTEATVAQSIRMIEAGCELVRLTAQGGKEANHLGVIKAKLENRGYQVPLIADIHFNPNAALAAASIVEKVRINPGNYTDRNTLNKLHFTDQEYNDELKKIDENLFPLLNLCNKHHTVIRIGVNHGSLSNRILSRYGNTPRGMVASALEFIEICRSHNFNDLVLSMKSSNIPIMVNAYRLLVDEMMLKGYDYPLHLGVTEAGNAKDGRIKSAAGIGTLLEDGIGDTIRVSLTEDPEFEIKPAIYIASKYHNRDHQLPEKESAGTSILSDTGSLIPTHSFKLEKPIVIANSSDISEGMLVIEHNTSKEEEQRNSDLNLKKKGELCSAGSLKDLIKEVVATKAAHPDKVIVLKRTYTQTDPEELMIRASIDFSYLLLHHLPDGIWIAGPDPQTDYAALTYDILQATGKRITKTEYIACPSCGRTQFNIQQAFEKVKTETSHLKGLKIAVMGCIVNGPGEMADADYGYVGMGGGKVALYKGQQQMLKNIPEEEALKKLIDLISYHGDWKEPS